MPMLLALLVVAMVLPAVLAVRRQRDEGAADGAARPAAVRALRALQARRPPVPRLLPPGHRPPPGLGPLSPSERFLRTEAARGLRELQMFLFEHRAA